MRKPVVHVIAPALFGGAESVVRSLVAGPRSASHVALLIQQRGPHPYAQSLAADAVPLTEIRCGRRRYVAESHRLSDLLRKLGARLLHTHVYHADFVGYFAARRVGIPVVATVHGFTAGDWKNRLYEAVDLRLLRRFDAVITVSASLRDQLSQSGISPRRLHLVPNGGPVSTTTLDRDEARAALGVHADHPLVGWVGRFTEEKGPDRFVRLMNRLADEGYQGVMVGDGPERWALEAATNNVLFLGEIGDVSALLPAFDVVAITSRTEGVPMLMLEAMAAGVPVVAFAVGGIPEVLHRDSGWLVTPGDLDAFGRAVVEAIEDDRLRALKVRRAGEVLEKRFGHDAWLGEIEQVYAEVLGQS